MINIRLKDSRSIHKFKRYNLILELFVMNAKDRLLFVIFTNLNAIIRILNINFNEMSRINKALQRFK